MGIFTNLLGRIGGSPASVSNDRPADDRRTERSELNRGPTQPQPQRKGEENSIAGSTANHNADKTAATAKSHAGKGSETLESFLTEARDSAQKLTQDVKNVHAQLGRRNHASSPGNQKIMAKSIQSAYPMAGAAAFAAFGVMLLAAGPFGALMGIALAYGAYAIHSAIKQHQEAQREMQDQDGNEGEGAGGHNPGGIGQSTNSLTSAASESRTEPESKVGASTLAAGQKQESKSVHGDLIDDDLKKNEDVDENDEEENAEPTADTRSRVAATTHQLGSTKANNLNASASAETAATVPLGEAQHTSAPPHSNTNSDAASTAPSTTQNNTSAERADGPTTHAGTSSASTSDSTATVTPETATAGASTSHAQT